MRWCCTGGGGKSEGLKIQPELGDESHTRLPFTVFKGTGKERANRDSNTENTVLALV